MSGLNAENENKTPSGEWRLVSPANLDLLLGTCQYRYSDIEFAMKETGATLIPADFAARLLVIAKLREKLALKKESIIEIAKRELGRSEAELFWEWSQTERFLSALLMDQTLDTKNTSPRGVTVFLASYVWPIFYTTQFAVMNFLAGNTLVAKPAEKSTLTTLALLECFREIPELNSIQVVVGDREVGRRLATHEKVSTLLFQGSFEVGMRVKQDALSMPGKEVLLYLGAKNPSIIFADARADVSDVILKDAFWGAGQHCRSVSLVFIENSRLKNFVSEFHERSKNFKIGGPESSAFMGPLIDGAMLDRYLKFIGISEREGAEIIMRGKPFTGSAEKGHFVTPSIALFESLTPDQLKRSVSLQTEILSPHLSIVGFADEAELSALLEKLTHGKLASIWTEDLARAKRIACELPVGEVVINQSVYDAEDPYQTVQSRKRSGNHAVLGRGMLLQLVFQKSIRSK